MNNKTKRILSFALASVLVSGVPAVSHAEKEPVSEEEYVSYVVKNGNTMEMLLIGKSWQNIII